MVVLVPLEDLKSLMARVDPLQPGERVRAAGGDREFGELAHSFNQMMERLETERRDSARRASAAEEGERQRLSREPLDEIGQRLGALLLALQPTAQLAARRPDLRIVMLSIHDNEQFLFEALKAGGRADGCR